MGNPIFISYRRDDTEGEAGRLFDDLTREFGANSVFMDVAGIRPGVDFVKAIEENVADCGVLLAVIGPVWATIADASGQRRLDDPKDFVALEIASALKREVPVIPVLVHGARMPTPDQLPESLKSFSYHNSVELSHARWPSDVQLLIDALNSYVAPNKATVEDPVHATVPVQLPAPHPPSAIVDPAAKRSGPASRVPFMAGIGTVVVVAVAVILYLAGHRTPVVQNNPVVPSTPVVPKSAAPARPSIVGTWVLPERIGGDTLNKLVISGAGSNLSMHAWGFCQPVLCDWGTQPAEGDGAGATATFRLVDPPGLPNTNRVATLQVKPTGNQLDVSVHNTFTSASGSRSNQMHRILVRGS